MRLSSAGRRSASAVLTVLAVLAASLLTATPATALNRATPGNFTGYGFDQCVTPAQAEMDTWLRTSPYWAVGIYIAGDSRYCGDDKQVNLTPEWVDTQLRNGWRLIPITVGPQASCAGRYQDEVRISPDPTNDYATARTQGRLEAEETVRRAQALGIVEGSTLWYDIEAYDIDRTRCRESALAFLSAWTDALHKLDYVSGVYSSAASGINALDDARALEPGRYTMPDRLWIADWIDEKYRKPPTATPPSLSPYEWDANEWLRSDGWMPNNRMRQYMGGHDETYGGVKINIDSNYLHLGRGSVAPREPRMCGGVDVNFPRYRTLRLGAVAGQVRAAHCLLRKEKVYDGRIRPRFTQRTQRAVEAFQERELLPVNGNLTKRTWVALLSDGAAPISKYGSASHAVRRLQRALNAATTAALEVTGVFDHATMRAVRDYQRAVGLRRTGVVAEDTWVHLQLGRR